MKSKTKIDQQLKKKNNPELVQTIIAAKKQKGWLEIAAILSGSRRNKIAFNLNEINKKAKDGETIVVPGKILSLGKIDKKIKLVAIDFSEKAKDNLAKDKIETLIILEEIKKNPSAKGVKIIK
ncbi:50S ribosomal protein L18e [Candidatus Pacearchaeota archaeon]|nr:50S ribosomal protein L18e [Candidatus Pacearchaeota archaeon]